MKARFPLGLVVGVVSAVITWELTHSPSWPAAAGAASAAAVVWAGRYRGHR